MGDMNEKLNCSFPMCGHSATLKETRNDEFNRLTCVCVLKMGLWGGSIGAAILIYGLVILMHGKRIGKMLTDSGHLRLLFYSSFLEKGMVDELECFMPTCGQSR